MSECEKLAVWGGVECTINRVGETFLDQSLWSGHRARVDEDLRLFAELGLRTLRTGLQWEQFEANGERGAGWESFDRTLGTMRELGLQPIAGLLHHGSGIRSTDLLDPKFPEKLAEYALAVAERYPWVTDYTPVNEPQTTGRFSCLYGHWFPHHRSMRSYARALYHQIRGVALSMRAVRTVQPEARLIHTEDGGRTTSTPQLESFRREREERRWLGTDLLCGLVTRHHPGFAFLTAHGLTEAEVLWFTENPCPPAVLGLNYYVTSDRYLDHRLQLYPPHLPGGDSGSEPLVDIEAVRVSQAWVAGAGSLLREAWERYRLPLAVTETHLGAVPEDQVRWLAEVWEGAVAARAAGAEVCAVTVWSLLGSWNWCDLCTADRGTYEPGVFDVRQGERRPTALAEVVRQLARGEAPRHPALAERGWWQREDRLTLPPYEADAVEEARGGAVLA